VSIALPQEWLAWMARLPADGGPAGADWVRSVGHLVDELLAQWELTVSGPTMTGWTAVVLPVEREGEPLS